MPLGEATETACAAVAAVKEKIDDYFVRCRLAQFDARSSDAMNVAEDTFKALGASALVMDAEAISALPLAKIVAAPVGAGDEIPSRVGDTPLELDSGINPAWTARIAALRDTLAWRPGKIE